MRVHHCVSRTVLAVAMGMVFQAGFAAESGGGTTATAPAAASTVAAAAVPPVVPDCVRFNQFVARVEVSIATLPVCLRVTPGMGGLRETLAEHGIGIGVSSMLGYTYDLNGNNAKVQTYNGQNPSYYQTSNLYLTYDLSRVGFSKDAQFTFSGQWTTSTYNAANPHLASMTIFAIDQPLFNKQLELIYGYIPGVRLFYGVTLGGNASTSALGPQSMVPFEVGMSASEPTPTFNAIVRDPSLRFYDSFAVTRSTSPDGLVKDIALNPGGFSLRVQGARALLINEMGYKRAASGTDNSLWLRFGSLYNTSPYTRYNASTPSSDNYEFYLAGTYQMTKPWGDARGLYIDAKVDWSPADRNAINRAGQVSAFYIGPFASRPFDMAAVGVTRSMYSADLRNRYAAYHIAMSKDTVAYTASYAARVIRGVYLISGLTYTVNPVFTPHHADALLLQETLSLTF